MAPTVDETGETARRFPGEAAWWVGVGPFVLEWSFELTVTPGRWNFENSEFHGSCWSARR